MNETPSADSGDEPTTTDGATPTESLTDPEALRDRDDVHFTEEVETLDRETYERVRGESEVGDGAALVGVTNDDGHVLLADTCTGWLPPGGNVDSGGDWAAVARREAESWTGVVVELDAVERVRRIDRRLEGADPSATPDLPFHVVYFRASLGTGEAVSDEIGDGPGGDDADAEALRVEWFDEVPEGVDSDHEDDVRVFLD